VIDMVDYDVLVIGAGPAGLSAAVSANNFGAKVLVVEREPMPGGILKQCIHDGFGVIEFRERLTGPEYAERYIEKLNELDIDVLLQSFVLDIKKENDFFYVTIQNNRGISIKKSKAIVLATGCRERTSKQIFIHGDRPAGVFTAGTAQYLVNIMGLLPCKRCVILGSGDIGLIMARRLTLEGAQVLGVYEIQSQPSGLARNISQCLEDFKIPLFLSHTVTRVFGKERLKAVEIMKVDENKKPIPSTARIIECDGLILAVGLIPENELAESLGIEMDEKTRGPVVDQNMMTSVKGVFSCGNALHVHDLVDYVTQTGKIAGRSAALYSKGLLTVNSYSEIEFSNDIAYCVPQRISFPCQKKIRLFFRVKYQKKNAKLLVRSNETITQKTFEIIRPQQTEFVDFEVSGGKIAIELAGLGGEDVEKSTKKIVCIVCPKGCEIEILDENNATFRGYSCPRGLEFAKNDLLNPKRILCTTVATIGHKLLPVKTDRPIPLESFKEVMDCVKKIVVEKPVTRGEIVFENIAKTGANLVATGTSKVIEYV